jgi:8-oxo-dGTP pyrophosphatase MutT (NUDIX family)
MENTRRFIPQAAVIAVRDGRVCLVLSNNRKRWVVPKGCIETGQSAGETALQEAWEEAGLVGLLTPDPLGTYLYEKAGKSHHVTVFLMKVTGVADDWPESEKRIRRWFIPHRATERIEEAGLQELIRGILLPEGVELLA